MRYIIPIMLLFLSACGGNSNEANVNSIEDQMKQVMTVHDSIMPWMDMMHDLQVALDVKIDEAGESGREPNEAIVDARNELESASEAMMVWMSEFQPEQYEEDKKALMNYLQEEEQKISEVGEEMKASITQAEKILSED